MGVTHETATRNSLATAIRDEIDTGGGGYLLFETSGDAEVARIDFATPNCGTVATGVLTFSGTPIGSDTSPAAAGTIAHASFYDGASAKIMQATVSTTSSTNNVQISTLTPGSTDTVTLNSLSWTAPL